MSFFSTSGSLLLLVSKLEDLVGRPLAGPTTTVCTGGLSSRQEILIELNAVGIQRTILIAIFAPVLHSHCRARRRCLSTLCVQCCTVQTDVASLCNLAKLPWLHCSTCTWPNLGITVDSDELPHESCRLIFYY